MDNETVPITVWAMKAEIDHTSYALRVASESYVFFEKFYQGRTIKFIEKI